ncbi:MAG: ATP-binding protein [Candidatus Saccharimonadales bacterium]
MKVPFAHVDNYYKQLLNILRYAGIAVPFAIIPLGLLAREGYLDNRSYAGDAWYIAISLAFLVLSAVQFVVLKNRPYPRLYLVFNTLYHIVGGIYILFVIGITSPFVVLWTLLMAGSTIYFGMAAFLASALVLATVALLNMLLQPAYTPSEQIGILIMTLSLIITGYIIAKLFGVTDDERVALARTRDQSNFQRERLLALVNSMGDAVVTTDENGYIKVYNAATLSLLDTNVNLTSKNIDNVLHLKDTKGRRVRLIDEAERQRAVYSRSDLSYRFADGEIMRLYVNVAPVQPGYREKGERGFILILRDITKEKTLEEERDEFISVVSHELRTPVAIAEGNLSNIRVLQEHGADPEMVLNAVDAAHEETIYLAKLVNDLGTLSRAERGVGAEAEIIDPVNLLKDMYETYLPRAEEKKLHLNLDLGHKLPKIRESRLYLEEVLQNFITNALKYTKEGSITIGCKLKSEGLVFSVQDTGIGISKSDQKHIFEKFYRSEDYRTRESSGTGLGLYVTKKLAHKMGLDIGFTSRLNHGSTFTFVVPPHHFADAAKVSAEAAQTAQAQR